MSPHDLLQSFDDLAPEPDDFLSDVVAGLGERPKTLPCKYFYDAKGSQLFDEICELPEYYPTRTEIALLNEISGDLARHIGPHAHIIEYGCGSVRKVRPLLDALDRPAAYVAVDISREHLLEAAQTLAADYPDIDVHAVCADFTKPFKVRPPLHRPNARRVGFFPGSTLGNFRPEDAHRFLGRAAEFLGPGGAMVIGIDLKKDETILDAAYNDSKGVTAAFNLNLLRRINRELGADFDVARFRHGAHYNAAQGRVEMHLYSAADQSVHVDGRVFRFAEGESIHTENSHKYGIGDFRRMARKAGFEPAKVWTDDAQLFSIHYLTIPQAR
jgi:dimethylhistidine N-methyltransferase